jgi:hypothetical protein
MGLPPAHKRIEPDMARIYKVILYLGFFGLLSIPIFQPFVEVPHVSAQATPAPEVVPAPAIPPAQPQRVPWYRDPARTALAGAGAGALATSLAALITGLMNLRVRKLTSKHELQKLSLEKQLTVYGNFFRKIVQVDILDAKDDPDMLFQLLMDLIAEYERSWPFLDKQTTKVFTEEISKPFEKEEFIRLFDEKGYDALYKEVRYRLMGKVMPTAKEFLDYYK